MVHTCIYAYYTCVILPTVVVTKMDAQDGESAHKQITSGIVKFLQCTLLLKQLLNQKMKEVKITMTHQVFLL